jgi:hypothetical protein
MKTQGELIWRSEDEQKKDLKQHIEGWKQGYSKDGYVNCAEGKFQYKGIFYLIKVLRYFNHTNKFCCMGSRISDKHVIVEYPDETKELRDLLGKIDFVYSYSEFLYHDTLYSYCDNLTIEQQIAECHRFAKKDIDQLKSISAEIKAKIKEIKETNRKIKEILKKK